MRRVVLDGLVMIILDNLIVSLRHSLFLSFASLFRPEIPRQQCL